MVAVLPKLEGRIGCDRDYRQGSANNGRSTQHELGEACDGQGGQRHQEEPDHVRPIDPEGFNGCLRSSIAQRAPRSLSGHHNQDIVAIMNKYIYI